MNIKNIILVAWSLCITALASYAQVLATYDEVLSKEKKGPIDIYITQKGEEFKVGDTISLGVAFRNEQFDFIQQNAGLSFYPLSNTASNSQVIIKKMNVGMRTVVVNTTKPQGFVYGLIVLNFESAIINGEIISKLMSSDKALVELKKYKDKLDLGLITEDEFNKKREELSKYIK